MKKEIIGVTAVVCCFILLCVESIIAGQNSEMNKDKPQVNDAQQVNAISQEGNQLQVTDVMSKCLLCQSGVLMNSVFAEADVNNSETTVSGGDGQNALVGNAQTVSGGDTSDEDEYANLAIADVSDYVNVRTEPNTDSKIVGKIYDGAVAQIISVAGDNNEWFYVESGSVTGYIKAEFFIYGDAAQDVIDDYVTRYVSVNADRLNVRKEPSTDTKRIGYVDHGERIPLLENQGEWMKVQYTSEKEGYVSAEYVTIVEEFTYAISIEEEKAALAKKKALEERANESEKSAPENTMTFALPSTTYTSNEELRKAIVDYAMQFKGNVYIHGGRSLSTGTDCSGFTCYIYADFGYSISRTPTGQYTGAGRAIDMSEIQPGDIICYSTSKNKCTHVGLYIGDGQIIHSANSRKGVIISAADYSNIIGVRNVID